MDNKVLIELLEEAQTLKEMGQTDHNLAQALQEELSFFHGGDINPEFMRGLEIVKAIRPKATKSPPEYNYSVLSSGDLSVDLVTPEDSLRLTSYLAAKSTVSVKGEVVYTVWGLGLTMISNILEGGRHIAGCVGTERQDELEIFKRTQKWARQSFEEEIEKGLAKFPCYSGAKTGCFISTRGFSQKHIKYLSFNMGEGRIVFEPEKEIPKEIKGNYVCLVDHIAERYFGRLKTKRGSVGGVQKGYRIK